MAAKHILPGKGGMYTSETVSAVTVASSGTDTFDLSLCDSFAVVCGGPGSNGSGSIQLQHSFNGGVSWSNFGSAITLTSAGPTTLFEQSDGPFGLMRFQSTMTAGTTQIYIVGENVSRA